MQTLIGNCRVPVTQLVVDLESHGDYDVDHAGAGYHGAKGPRWPSCSLCFPLLLAPLDLTDFPVLLCRR